MKKRHLASILKARLSEEAPLIQVVIGPRQVGKTTALKSILPKRAHYHSADYPTPLDATVLEEWWKRAEKNNAPILAVDEVQKIRNWSSVIKMLWDKGTKLKVVLMGSSALLVEKGLHESLAGRFELIRAEHWNFKEAKRVFDLDLEKFIEFGCYPGGQKLLKDPERWGEYIRDSIVELVLGRDLIQLHPVANPALLRQVFGLAVGMPAQIISLQKLQGQLQGKGSLPTLQHYLSLLGQSFLVSSLEKYTSSLLRRKKSSPKLIVHDNGLIRAFERPITDDLSPERRGRYVENIVGARFIEAGWNVFYWKERDLEVDFVVLGPKNEKWAIEVKSARCQQKDLVGLTTFCHRHKEFKPKFVSLIGQKIKGIGSLKIERVLSLARSSST